MGKTLSGKDVFAIRDELDLSQAVLAKALNIEAQTIFKYENGERIPRGAVVMLLLLLDKRPELIFDLMEIVEGRYLDNDERVSIRKKGGRKSALGKVKSDAPISLDLNYLRR